MKKKTKRKHYPLIDVVRHAIEGACITDQTRLDKLRMRELSAIQSFATGHAQPSDWRELADMHNVATMLVSMNIGGHEAKQACELASQALQDAHAAQASRGKLGMTGPQIGALRELYEWHDAQRTAINRSLYEKAIEKTVNVIRSRRADVVRMEC